MKRILVGSLLGLLVMACTNSTAVSQQPSVSDSLSFIVIGDVPYSNADKEMLAKALPLVQAGSYPFVIHVGDYKGGGATCTADHDEYHQNLIGSLQPVPVFYTPGDNEWTDCDRGKDPENGNRMSDLDRLETVRELFFTEPVMVPNSFNYARQNSLKENASWTYQDVQFLTLHVTGTNNGRDWVTGDPLERALEAVTARDAANLNWLRAGFAAARSNNASAVIIGMQADMTDIKSKPDDVMCTTVAVSNKHECDAFTELRMALRDAANDFTGPVLLIHGDTAPFTLNQKFSGEEATNLWRLNAAGDTGIGRTGMPYGTRDITVVTYDATSDVPFSARGLLTGKSAK